MDFPRLSLLVARLPCRPIPALPAHSLCSTPQRKCQVWPLEGAGGPVRTKKSLGFPTPPPPPPTHPDDRWCSSCATKCSRSAIGEGCDVREGCSRDWTNVSVFLSKGSLLLHSCCCYTGLCRAVCGNFQLSQTLSFQQRKRRRRTVFDTQLDCSHSDHNMDGTYRVTSEDNFGDFDIDNMPLTSNCHVRPMP